MKTMEDESYLHKGEAVYETDDYVLYERADYSDDELTDSLLVPPREYNYVIVNKWNDKVEFAHTALPSALGSMMNLQEGLDTTTQAFKNKFSKKAKLDNLIELNSNKE